VRFDVEEYLFHIEEPPAPKGDLTVRRALPPKEVIADGGRAKVPAGWSIMRPPTAAPRRSS